MLDQRLQCWPHIKPALCCLDQGPFAGAIPRQSSRDAVSGVVGTSRVPCGPCIPHNL